MPPAVIAIDGPAGSGKTVVGKRVADALGYLYVDTGAYYRATALLALRNGVDPRDGPALARLLHGARIEITGSPVDAGRWYHVLLNGEDVTRDLTAPPVARAVSIVAAHPEVRAELLPVQRRAASQGKVVIAGRDIGTVVCPFAGLKLYLDAPLTVRIARRLAQLEAAGTVPDPDAVAAEMAERDRLDGGRAVAPLKPAPDAVMIDSSTLTVDQEVAQILDVIARRGP